MNQEISIQCTGLVLFLFFEVRQFDEWSPKPLCLPTSQTTELFLGLWRHFTVREAKVTAKVH